MTGSFARRAPVCALLAICVVAPAALGGSAAAVTGQTWSAGTSPLPVNAAAATQQEAVVSSIACFKGLCVAGGHYVAATGDQEALVLVRTGGKWMPSGVLPADSSDAMVTGVACDAAECAAVGSSVVTGVGDRALVLAESGGAWSEPTLSGLTTQSSSLTTVACSQTLGCVGFGSGVVADDVGGNWTLTALPAPVGFHGTPGTPRPATVVAATCTATCVAVGSSYLGGDPGNYGQGAVIVQGSGTTWSDRAAALPANSVAYTDAEQAGLNGVSCIAKSCVAVGYYTATTGRREGLLEARVAGKWSDDQAPQPTGPASTLSAVACAPTGSCVAAGGFTDATTGGENLLLTGAPGSSWTAAAAPLPSGGTSSLGLNAVSCGSGSLCAATGLYSSGTSIRTAGELLTGAATGSSWSATAAPVLKGTVGSKLAAVSCTASTCVAAGQAPRPQGPYSKGLFETHKG